MASSLSKRRRTMKATRSLRPPRDPTMALVNDLISLAHEMCICERPQVCQLQHSTGLIRRVKLLAPLFEEIRDTNPPLPPSAVLAFKDLYALIEKGKLLVEYSGQGSTTWLLLDSHSISRQFEAVNRDLVTALDAIPLSLLEISDEMKEQIVLLSSQTKRRKSCIDLNDEQLRELLLSALKQYEAKEEVDVQALESLLSRLQLRNCSECEIELVQLEEEKCLQSLSGNREAFAKLNALVGLISSIKRLLYGPNLQEEHCQLERATQIPREMMVTTNGCEESEDAAGCNIPDEFKCPISLEMMMDPVIIATGQTYDRESIAMWIAAGHSTCPKSGQKLIHLSLISNYALRSLIAQWCEERNIPYEPSSSNRTTSTEDMEQVRESLEVAKRMASFLVGKLASGGEEIQKQVAYELRLLAKIGTDNRICIAEAGAIPFVVPLLVSKDPKTQEDAVTALLNLSIYDRNKKLIMAAGFALEYIIRVLVEGFSMEGRQNAAATLFSLSTIDEYKVIIGQKEDAIAGLVKLLVEGTLQAKKDATMAMFNLVLYPGNRKRLVNGGAVGYLVVEIVGRGVTDDALAVLALLAESVEGVEAISEAYAIPLLVQLLQNGSAKGKENSLSVLLAVCKNGDESIRDFVLDASQSLHDLLITGTPRARRKAHSLLKFIYSCAATT